MHLSTHPCVSINKGATEIHLSRVRPGDFPGGPVVKTLPSNAGGGGSIPGQGAMIPHASWPMSNRNSIVMNSVKTLKMVHIKKKIN